MGQATTLALRVSGMHCASCGLLIDEAVEELAGVERSQTDSRRGRTVVRADLSVASVEHIVAAIAEAGYQAEATQV
ncbi:MAG: cation transporter [Actinomycetota bacterium]|nr:cation transporter [Actinomycetota bacterium]